MSPISKQNPGKSWLLKNVFWWYLAPLAAGLVIWFAYCNAYIDIAVSLALYAGVYWLNQWAVRKELLPRKQELEQLRTGLQDNTP